ncbi:MAG: acyl carrier protein [Planctomycetes bacterium]|nr:acyl carrier protein [Planctomycetota bacterium]
MEEIVTSVRGFIVNNFMFGDDQGLQNNASFLETGIIDSTGILELVTFLEETYDIQIQDDELVPENLDSIVNIEQFLKKKLACVE